MRRAVHVFKADNRDDAWSVFCPCCGREIGGFVWQWKDAIDTAFFHVDREHPEVHEAGCGCDACLGRVTVWVTLPNGKSYNRDATPQERLMVKLDRKRYVPGLK